MSEFDSEFFSGKDNNEIHLRSVDLNLLTVFDTVMQIQNITRAAHHLGMSQPAVSNSVARLKVMFNDDLFVRHGRGIQPTIRAQQLFGPIRQALQMVQSELPGTAFNPQVSERLFNIAICSPLDLKLTARIINEIKEKSPKIRLQVKNYLNESIENQLRNQETEFVIGYNFFEHSDFKNTELFNDDLVLVVAKNHPRIGDAVSQQQMEAELHAVVSLERFCSFSRHYYQSSQLRNQVRHQCTDLFSALMLVAATDLVSIVPRWFVKQYQGIFALKAVALPWDKHVRTCYLSSHASAERDRGHQWMRTLLQHSIMSME